MENIIYRDISELNKLQDNPRTITKEDFARLVTSIKKFGVIPGRPLLLSNRTGKLVILGGNQRYEACKKLGITNLPTYLFENISEEDEKEVIIRDNVANGEWDTEILGNLWDPEMLKEFGVDLPDIVEQNEAIVDSFQPQEDLPTDIVRGDMIEIGNHFLICGDSTKAEDVEKLLGGGKADMTFSDPPYLMNFQGGMSGKGVKNSKHKVLTNDNLNKEDGDKFLYEFLLNVKKYVTGAFYVSFYRLGLHRMFTQMEKSGLQYRNVIIWKKNHKNLSNSDYQAKYEPIVYGYTQEDYIPILYGWNEKHVYRGGKGLQDDVWELDTLWEIDRTKVNDMHPTMKPVELLQRIIENSSKKGDKVLDLFMGSGTTMVVCHLIGRQCFGVEFEPSYCQTIINGMIELDPTIEVKVNGKPYIPKE